MCTYYIKRVWISGSFLILIYRVSKYIYDQSILYYIYNIWFVYNVYIIHTFSISWYQLTSGQRPARWERRRERERRRRQRENKKSFLSFFSLFLSPQRRKWFEILYFLYFVFDVESTLYLYIYSNDVLYIYKSNPTPGKRRGLGHPWGP